MSEVWEQAVTACLHVSGQVSRRKGRQEGRRCRPRTAARSDWLGGPWAGPRRMLPQAMSNRLILCCGGG